MIATISALWLAILSTAIEPSESEVRALIDTIESLTQPVGDFRCEFEGRLYLKGTDTIAGGKLGPDGLYDEFSGIFIWRRGDTLSDGMHRLQPHGRITRDLLAIRTWENQAEQYERKDAAPFGSSTIDSPRNVYSCRPGSFGEIFLIDEIKRIADDPFLECSVGEEQVAGRPLKVLSVGLKGVPDSLMRRLWIDLGRTGQVVRDEAYLTGKDVLGRMDIQLAPFEVGGVKVWMPIRGDSVSYADEKDHKPIVAKEPTVVETIYLNSGSMEFNTHPARDSFRIGAKPGTPITDNLRRLQYEFGQQRSPERMTTRESEASLREQLSEAERQGKELMASSPARDRDLSTLLVWVFGATALASSLALWIHRRRH